VPVVLADHGADVEGEEDSDLGEEERRGGSESFFRSPVESQKEEARLIAMAAPTELEERKKKNQKIDGEGRRSAQGS